MCDKVKKNIPISSQLWLIQSPTFNQKHGNTYQFFSHQKPTIITQFVAHIKASHSSPHCMYLFAPKNVINIFLYQI